MRKIVNYLSFNLIFIKMEKTVNYAMMAIGLSLGIMTMLPEFSIFSFVFDFTGFVCHVGAAVLMIMAFVKQLKVWKAEGAIPLAFVIPAAICATMCVITTFFDLFGVFNWIGFIAGIVALIMSCKAFNLNSNPATAGAITMAAATTAAFYEINNDDAILVNIAAIVAYVFIMKGAKAIPALGKMKLAAIFGIVASVLFLIKVTAFLGWIPYMVFAVLVMLAYIGFKKSVAAGGSLLMIAGILLLVEEVLDFIPVVDIFVCPILLIAVLALNIFGWIKAIGSMARA